MAGRMPAMSAVVFTSTRSSGAGSARGLGASSTVHSVPHQGPSGADAGRLGTHSRWQTKPWRIPCLNPIRLSIIAEASPDVAVTSSRCSGCRLTHSSDPRAASNPFTLALDSAVEVIVPRVELAVSWPLAFSARNAVMAYDESRSPGLASSVPDLCRSYRVAWSSWPGQMAMPDTEVDVVAK